MIQRKVKRNYYYFLFSIRVSGDISYILTGKLSAQRLAASKMESVSRPLIILSLPLCAQRLAASKMESEASDHNSEVS